MLETQTIVWHEQNNELHAFVGIQHFRITCKLQDTARGKQYCSALDELCDGNWHPCKRSARNTSDEAIAAAKEAVAYYL